MKKKINNLRRVRLSNKTNGHFLLKDNKVIGMVNTEKKDDGKIWIQGLEVFGENKGQGFGKQLLDIAVKELGATNLSVRKNNKIAKKMYDKYGFKIYKEDDFMYYMNLNKETKYDSN